MRVRPATTDDQAAILEVHERAVYELAGEHYCEAVLDAWTDLADGEDAAEDEAEDSENGTEESGNEVENPENGAEGPEDDGEDDAQPEDGRLFVAEVDDAVAGFGDVRFEPPEYLEEPADGGVRAVYVHPDYARQGVGSSLLERLEATARETGVESIGLQASVNARPFYERHGYEVVTEVTFEFGGEVEGPAVEMRKEL